MTDEAAWDEDGGERRPEVGMKPPERASWDGLEEARGLRCDIVVRSRAVELGSTIIYEGALVASWMLCLMVQTLQI